MNTSVFPNATQQSEEDRKLAEKAILIQAKAMEPFVRSEGYLVLRRIAEAQILNWMQNIVNEAGTRDADMYKKGIIYGIRTLLNTPDQILEHRKEILNRMLEDVPDTTEASAESEPAVSESPDDSIGTYVALGEERPHGE